MQHTYCPKGTEGLPQELVDFSRRQIVNATMYKGDERRREGRHPMLLPVLAVEVDEDNYPIGEPFQLVTRDVSASAVGLVYTRRITAKRLAIQFTIAGTQVTLIVAVVWSNPLGPFYGAGAKFLQKLTEFPQPF